MLRCRKLGNYIIVIHNININDNDKEADEDEEDEENRRGRAGGRLHCSVYMYVFPCPAISQSVSQPVDHYYWLRYYSLSSLLLFWR